MSYREQREAEERRLLDEMVTVLERYRSTVAAYREHHGTVGHQHASCPLRAAVRRSSLDLTRALAKLRREYGLW